MCVTRGVVPTHRAFVRSWNLLRVIRGDVPTHSAFVLVKVRTCPERVLAFLRIIGCIFFCN